MKTPLHFWARIALVLCLVSVVRAKVDAQDAPPAEGTSPPAQREVTTTALVIARDDATEGDASIVSIGLRRGITEVDGVRFVHPVDVLSPVSTTEDLDFGLEELNARIDQLAEGDARDVASSTDALIELFEANLPAVRREQLLDVYMVNALARCRMDRERECEQRLARIFVFREEFEYDATRFPAEYAAVFERTRARITAGPRASLTVSTEPAGAEIYIDGRSYGPSPAVADDLLIGDHYITIKMLDRTKVVTRATLGRNGSRVSYDLAPNARARLVASPENLRAVLEELGEPRAGTSIRSVGTTLGAAQVVVARLSRARPGALTVDAFLYDVRTRFLLAQRSVEIASAEEGLIQVQQLAIDLYEGVDLSGAVVVDEIPEPEHRAEAWEEWWFWTSIGVAAVAIGVGVGFGVQYEQDQRRGQLPDGWVGVQGSF